jgi:acetoin utilization deacetylase AcuC-like enzyme
MRRSRAAALGGIALAASRWFTTPCSALRPPLIISSDKMLRHRDVSGYGHPECPERVKVCLDVLQHMQAEGLVRLTPPAAETDPAREHAALDVINSVHDHAYVKEVKMRCDKGARVLSPWDADTYINKFSFEQCLHAQSAWLQGVDEVVTNKTMAFAVVRPPGHHAIKDRSMGFCIFNFAVGAATYAIEKYGLSRVSILDFDVHYGNGVADLVASNPKIRYSSLHQDKIFPNNGHADVRGQHNNILNVPLPGGTAYAAFQPPLVDKVLPFLAEWQPELLIVCAGYDALASDEMANFQLQVKDYGDMAAIIQKRFGSAVLFGLEGGYNLNDLPLAVKQTILPFTSAGAGAGKS